MGVDEDFLRRRTLWHLVRFTFEAVEAWREGRGLAPGAPFAVEL